MVKVFEDRKITIEEELRFEMMRHWNLYDAMLHSPYVVTRLQTWKESGVHLLDSLLATCGLSLHDASKNFRTSKRGKANAGKIERARRVAQRVARFDVLVVYVPTRI